MQVPDVQPLSRTAMRLSYFLVLALAAMGWAPSRPGPGRLTATADASAEWEMVLLPDTQGYVENDTLLNYFMAQTQWVADNRVSQNIRMVAHLGDMTGGANTEATNTAHWDRAVAAMSVVTRSGVPWIFAPGNHDTDWNKLGYVFTYCTSRFPASLFEAMSGATWTPGDSRRRHDNADMAFRFSAGSADWIVVAIHTTPDENDRAWARAVFAAYPKHRGILITHAYLSVNGLRFAEGDQIWTDVVYPNPNVVLVASGHQGTTTGLGARRQDMNRAGKLVLQMVSDYEGLPNYGNGYLRQWRFVPRENALHVTTYSPYLKTSLTDGTNQFSWTLP